MPQWFSRHLRRLLQIATGLNIQCSDDPPHTNRILLFRFRSQSTDLFGSAPAVNRQYFRQLQRQTKYVVLYCGIFFARQTAGNSGDKVINAAKSFLCTPSRSR